MHATPCKYCYDIQLADTCAGLRSQEKLLYSLQHYRVLRYLEDL